MLSGSWSYGVHSVFIPCWWSYSPMYLRVRNRTVRAETNNTWWIRPVIAGGIKTTVSGAGCGKRNRRKGTSEIVRSDVRWEEAQIIGAAVVLGKLPKARNISLRPAERYWMAPLFYLIARLITTDNCRDDLRDSLFHQLLNLIDERSMLLFHFTGIVHYFVW